MSNVHSTMQNNFNGPVTNEEINSYRWFSFDFPERNIPHHTQSVEPSKLNKIFCGQDKGEIMDESDDDPPEEDIVMCGGHCGEYFKETHLSECDICHSPYCFNCGEMAVDKDGKWVCRYCLQEYLFGEQLAQ